jgi:hypothetical protein
MTRATIIFVAWPLLTGRKWEGMAAIQGHKLPSWSFCEWTQRGTIQRHVPETQVGHHQLVEQRWEQLPGCESSPSRPSRPHPSRGWSGWRSWCKVVCSLCSLFFQINSWCMALLSIICNPEDSSWVCSLSSQCLTQCHVHQNSLWYVVWTDCQGCGSPICAGLGLDLCYPVMLFNLILTISLFPWSFTWHHPHMNSLANRYSDSNFLSVLQRQEYRYLGRGLGFQHWVSEDFRPTFSGNIWRGIYKCHFILQHGTCQHQTIAHKCNCDGQCVHRHGGRWYLPNWASGYTRNCLKCRCHHTLPLPSGVPLYAIFPVLFFMCPSLSRLRCKPLKPINLQNNLDVILDILIIPGLQWN